MDFLRLKDLLDEFKATPGLAMPPVHVYAASFVISNPPYNTGLFNNLHGRPVIYLDDLQERCIRAAEECGLKVANSLRERAGNIPVDAPQVASIIASSLGEMSMRYGARHLPKINKWVQSSFEGILQPLTPEIRLAGADWFRVMNDAYETGDNSAINPELKAKIESQAEQLESPKVVTAMDFLIKRQAFIMENQKLDVSKDLTPEP